MKIIGIDPGINRTGYGIVDFHSQQFHLIDYGCASSNSKDCFNVRLTSICNQIKTVLDLHKPDMAVIEDIFYAVNIKSALKLGHIRGALIMTIANCGINIFELTPLEIKQGVTGYGRADKNQVAEMVRILLGLGERPTPLDSSDALAAAIAYAFRSDYEELIKTK